MRFLSWFRLGCGLLAAGLMCEAAWAATWFPLGPFGGSARSLEADPADSRHLFLGTATGWIYDSHDGGEHWSRVAQISKRNDLVIDHIVVDHENPKRLIVGAYTVDHVDGGVFISENYGKDWYSQAEMRGQSVRALTRANSDPKELIAGTLQGIFRSPDNGVHWKQISPEGSAEIKEVQSIAIDPADPNVIYAGTWHLPWKTTDGGATWSNIKKGIIDDSDVFSIIVDPKNPKIVYASACSGIYKSASAGEGFTKVQGIPSAARRTRTLEQDPGNLDVVFAGTTEGLYRTQDAGAKWERLTPDDVVVNDVYVDPGNSQHVLLATDRGGVYRSEDGGTTFAPSNEGFSARQVTAYTADGLNAGTVYVGVVNDKATGGVFQSTDGGVKWRQQSEGLGGRDVFSLLALSDGTLLAGTEHGIFRLQAGSWTESSALEGDLTKEKAAAAPKTGPVLTAPTRLTTPSPRSGTGRAKPKPGSAKVSPTRAAGRSKPRARPRTVAGRRPPARGPRTAKGAHLLLVKGRSRPAAAAASKAHGAAARVHGAQEAKPSQVKPTSPAAPRIDRLDGVVYSLARAGDVLFAGSSAGLLRSVDAGQHWTAIGSLSMPDVHYVGLLSPGNEGTDGSGAALVLAGGLQQMALSPDGGATWKTISLPGELTQIGAVAIDGEECLWVGGREGVWLSTDNGASWKTLRNLFLTEVDNIYFDPSAKRVLVTASNSPVAFSVTVPDHKVSYWDTGWMLRFVRPVGDHLIGATLFDGVVVQPKMVDSPEPATVAASSGR